MTISRGETVIQEYRHRITQHPRTHAKTEGTVQIIRCIYNITYIVSNPLFSISDFQSIKRGSIIRLVVALSDAWFNCVVHRRCEQQKHCR
jgi:hypothetical protein